MQGNINEEKAFKVVNHMLTNGYPVNKIEDFLWRLKKYYDERARFYSNMHSDLMHQLDVIDNQELEQHDFGDTTND